MDEVLVPGGENGSFTVDRLSHSHVREAAFRQQRNEDCGVRVAFVRFERKLHVLFIIGIFHVTVCVVRIQEIPERKLSVLCAVLDKVSDQRRHFQ